MWLIIYQKSEKGDTLYHLLRYPPIHKIGYVNSFGWKVISIQYFYKNKFVDYDKYQHERYKKYKKRKEKTKFRKILDIIKEK